MGAQGYDVLTAKDGQEEWKIFQKEKKDIVLAVIDWIMSRMDGLKLCQKIKKSQIPYYVYVIFLTGKVNIDNVVEGLESGADDYLTKPFDKRELLSRINVGKRFVQL